MSGLTQRGSLDRPEKPEVQCDRPETSQDLAGPAARLPGGILDRRHNSSEDIRGGPRCIQNGRESVRVISEHLVNASVPQADRHASITCAVTSDLFPEESICCLCDKWVTHLHIDKPTGDTILMLDTKIKSLSINEKNLDFVESFASECRRSGRPS